MNTVFHSDQGGQYNEKEFKKLLKKHGMRSSIGTSGDCYDNAPMESFWATMKTELMHHMPFRDVQHARDVSNAGYICSITHVEDTHRSTACPQCNTKSDH